MQEILLGAPNGPDRVDIGPEIPLQPIDLEPAEHPHLSEVPRLAGSLLTETVTTVNWEKVEAAAPEQARRRLAVTAMRHVAVGPVVAGSLATHLLPSEQRPMPPRRITAEQVKQERPVLGFASGVIGFFSPKLAARFDGWLAKKAQHRIDTKTGQTARFIETVGAYESPKAGFVAEIARIRELLQNDKHGREPSELLGGLLWDASSFGTRQPMGSYSRWLQENCPLIAGALPIFMNPALGAKLKHPHYVRAITPELVSGIEGFLQQANAGQQPAVPFHVNVDYSMARKLGMRFRRKEIAAVPDRVRDALSQVYDLLPDDGPLFQHQVTNAVRQASAIEDPKELMRALLKQEKRREKVSV